MVRQLTDDKLDVSTANISEKENAKNANVNVNVNTNNSAYTITANDEPADFETAISATGFGKFNIILFMIALPSAWSSEFDFTAISYVLPAAQCDLHLTLVDKGILNAMSYLGSLTSAFLWGFLADTLGRRKLLIVGYFADSIFVLLSSLSQTSWMLGFSKFMNGFLISGPYAILMSFISEFHAARYRAPILLLSGIFFSLANVAMSGLAWWIIPQRISLSLLNGYVEIHSWQVYLMICTLPSLISAFAYLLVLPESPKFLMTAGRREEALAVFQRVYTMNTGNPPENFPIKRLIDENSKQENKKVPSKDNAAALAVKLKGVLQSVQTGWNQIRPIFAQPHLNRIAHIFFTLFLGMLGENTLRLWMPQLFTKMDEFNQMHNYTKSASLCEMLEEPTVSNNETILLEEICTVTVVDDQVYINTIIVAMCNVLGFIIASSVVNRLGKKWLLVIIYGICGVTSVGNYWSISSTITLILVSVYGSVSSVCTSTMISVIVDLFPTTLRTMTISLAMMTGRTGSIIGNVLFPVLLQTGCLPPFLLIGGTALVCSIICIFLPNANLGSLD